MGDTRRSLLNFSMLGADAGRVTTTSPEHTGSPDEEMAALRARLAALEGATTRRKPGRGKRAVSIVALVAAGAALLAVGDWYEQNREMGGLVAAVEAHQAAYIDLSEQWGALGADGNVGGDQLKQQSVVAAVRPKMLVSQSAAEDVMVLPWHVSIAKTRDGFVDYFEENDKLLASIGTDNRNFDVARMDAAQMTAEAELSKAIPVVPLYDLDERVKTYLAAQEENYAGG